MVKLKKASLITLSFLGIAFVSQNAYAKPSLGKASSISYEDPSKWASLAPGYKLCSTGSRQSPIDIQSNKTVASKQQQLYPRRESVEVVKASLTNNGVTLQLTVTGKNDVSVEGKDYRLFNIRWHTPSEHFIDGVQLLLHNSSKHIDVYMEQEGKYMEAVLAETERLQSKLQSEMVSPMAFDLSTPLVRDSKHKYDAEMHQVYVATDGSGNMVIIATLYKIGPKEDPIVAAIRPEMGKLSGASEEYVSPSKFTADLLKNIPSDKYYRYSGSVTFPPCTEQVTWFVVPTTLPMSRAEVEALARFVTGPNKKNARPLQPLKGRVVQVVGTSA